MAVELHETATGPPAVKPMPKSPPPDILPSQPTPQPTSWISFNPSTVPDQPSPTMLMLMQEPDWLETQVAMLRDGPKPWFLPRCRQTCIYTVTRVCKAKRFYN
eukprot:196393-Amphidinium_carterae.1